MSNLTTTWKVFRIGCSLQLIAVAFELLSSIANLFFSEKIVFPVIGIIVYTLVLVFVYQGLSLLNDHYPDQPLSAKQKKQFNWLFLINVLLIIYLFAQVVTNYGILPLIWGTDGIDPDYLPFLLPFVMALLIFLFHLVFLAGMYRLRRTLHQNTLRSWYRQFDTNP